MATPKTPQGKQDLRTGIYVYLERDLLANIREAAKENGRSVSAEMRYALKGIYRRVVVHNV